MDTYQESVHEVWIMQLNTSFNRIQDKVYNHTKKTLRQPILSIIPAQRKWGEWNPNTRVLSLSEALFKRFEFGAVEHVLKHEVAHQIVSEIFDMDCYGVAHGKAWAEACKIVDIEPNRCDSADFLSSFKGSSEEHPIVNKIRKLLARSASDSGATEAEAESCIRKTQEIMMRYNISMSEVTGDDRLFLKRPFGENYSRWPGWMWGLGDFLVYQYDIKILRSWGPHRTYRLELFGEPDNLDIAEYVGYAIINQGKILWEEYKKTHNARMKVGKSDYELGISTSDSDYYDDHSTSRWSNKHESMVRRNDRISERAFMEGLISGYSSKMTSDRKDIEDKINAEDGALVIGYDTELLEEMYGTAYTGLRNISIGGSTGGGYGGGYSAGGNLRISRGVGSSGNGGRLLTA